MKKTKHIALATTLCLSLMLTGCSSPPTESSEGLESANSSAYVADNAVVRKTFAEIRESFDSDVEAIKSKQYDNLNFDKAVFSQPPQIDSICELKLVRLTGKSTDEIYDFFCETIDRFTDNKFTDEEKRYEIRFLDGESKEDVPYPYRFPNIDEYKDGQETDNPWLVFKYGNCAFIMTFGVMRESDNGDLLNYDGAERDVLYSYPISYNDNHRHVLYTEDLTCTDTYRLVDGEISIADAAKFAQNYLDEFDCTPYDDANMPKPVIYAVNVFDIGGGCYGYCFATTYEYNGIWFDRFDSKKGGSGMTGVKTDYDDHVYGSWMGDVEMIRTDRIHYFDNIMLWYDLIEGEPTTEIITVGSAADAVSDFFSGFMKFNVTEVSMTWLRTNEYGTAEQEAYPCWKFKMYANGEIYHTFVDVITGEIHLYVQVV